MCQGARHDGGDKGDSRGGTTGGAAGAILGPLREEARAREEAGRRALGEAALEAAGELGPRRLSVEAIIARAGVSRARFYRLFADKEECLAEGRRVVLGRLVEEVLRDLAAGPGPETGLRRALGRVATLTEARPLVARGLLAEEPPAGGASSAARQEAFERLSRACLDARRETVEPRHSSPPLATGLILAAVGSAVAEASSGDGPAPLGGRIDALVELACLLYGRAETTRPGSPA